MQPFKWESKPSITSPEALEQLKAIETLAHFDWEKSRKEADYFDEEERKMVSHDIVEYFSIDDFLKGISPNLLKDPEFWSHFLENTEIRNNFPVYDKNIGFALWQRIPESVKKDRKTVTQLITFFDRQGVIKSKDFDQRDYDLYHDLAVFASHPDWHKTNFILAELFHRSR